jgi:hypothetical protein
MDDTIADKKSAFSEIAPLIQRKFPDAVMLHNSGRAITDEIDAVERLEKIRFARGPDGRVVTCHKDLSIIMEFLRTMVVPREERMAKTSGHNSAPFCQRCVPAPKPQLTCCRM